jgi:hypothetical protein
VSIGVNGVMCVVLYPPGTFGTAARVCLWVPKDGVVAEVNATRGHVRALCRLLGITLTP